MRGKVDQVEDQDGQVRITPAHAGKSFHADHQGRQQKDHPRTCGEKTKKIP